MKLCWTILGSSAGGASAERNNSGYVLSLDERLVIFDCGSGVASSFMRSGFEPLDVEAILISHTHPDHISDFPLFVQMMYLSGREKTLAVYLPAEAVKPVREYLSACYLFPEKLRFPLELKPMESEIHLLDDSVIVTPVANNHLKGNAPVIEELGYPNLMECYSFLVRVEGKSLLYSADVSALEDIEEYLHDLDILVVETAHIDLDHLLGTVRQRGIRKVVLTHTMDEDLSDVRKTAGKSIKGVEILVAEDNLAIEL